MYQVNDLVRLNNGGVAIVISARTREYVMQLIRGPLPPMYRRCPGGIGVLPEYVKCRVKAVFDDIPEPKRITALDARRLTACAAVEHGQEVTATKIGDDHYRLSFLGDPDVDESIHYFTDVRQAEDFLNSLP